MKFAVVKNKRYTGVIYTELTPEIQDWVDATEGASLVALNIETEALIRLAEMQAGDSEPDYPEVTQDAICATVRYRRDNAIEEVQWRIDRHNQELALQIEPTEPLEPLLQYVQALRDLPDQAGFPENVEWPECP